MADPTPPLWVVQALLTDAPPLDFAAIRAEWLQACRAMVEHAIQAEGTQAARTRAGQWYLSMQADEVDMRWAVARARDPQVQLDWSPAVARAQREQADVLVKIIRKYLEVARG